MGHVDQADIAVLAKSLAEATRRGDALEAEVKRRGQRIQELEQLNADLRSQSDDARRRRGEDCAAMARSVSLLEAAIASA